MCFKIEEQSALVFFSSYATRNMHYKVVSTSYWDIVRVYETRLFFYTNTIQFTIEWTFSLWKIWRELVCVAKYEFSTFASISQRLHSLLLILWMPIPNTILSCAFHGSVLPFLPSYKYATKKNTFFIFCFPHNKLVIN